MSITRVNQPGTNAAQAQEASGAKKSNKAAAEKNPNAAAAARSGNAAASGATNTQISEKGREIAKAKATASGAPDVREEKIAALKAKIAEGKYKVDADKVADKMVDDHMQMSGMS